MITTPTVLVLGAGASHPYGFPVGSALKSRIIKAIRRREPSFYPLVLGADNYSTNELDSLADDLYYSSAQSIDAFLANRPKYRNIGKAAIACALIPFEMEETLYEKQGEILSAGNSWYAYLFSKLTSGASEDEFSENQLSVVTFNYDRSLEYFLFRSLLSAYPITEEKSADLVKSIPIIHVHGKLGDLPYLGDKDEDIRPYTHELRNSRDVKLGASKIKIIYEDMSESEEFSEANRILSSAEYICFLGFGYHPDNLQRLNLDPHGLQQPNKQRIKGSAFRLTLKEQAQILTLMNARRGSVVKLSDAVELYDGTNLEALRRFSVLGW